MWLLISGMDLFMRPKAGRKARGAVRRLVEMVDWSGRAGHFRYCDETLANQIIGMRGIGNKILAVLAGGGLLVAPLVMAIWWPNGGRPARVRDFYPKTPPRRVVISGYQGDTMEPFISRDGRYLLFNNLNQPPVNTDIFYAERQDDFNWMFRGPVRGVNTPALEGCPTMDRNGQMFFVSPRDYARTLCTIYTGKFKDGEVAEVRLVESISRKQPGMVNFDVDVSPDGSTLIFVDSRFKPGAGPQFARLVMAVWNGTQFVRSPDSDRLMATVNQAGLNYAPTISASLRTLFFTRFDARSGFKGPQIYRATRPTVTVPFDPPEHLAGLGDYVEGSAFGPDERIRIANRD